jgi:signal transduction histidine kinase
VLSEVARKTSAVHNGNQIAEPLKKISTVSNELVETMSDIVWAINPHKDHLSDLAQRMRRFASDVFAAKQISFHFQTPSLKIETPLGANIRREVFLIFKESVNNIVKHSECSNVEIDFKVEGKMLTLKLQDNGCGFDISSFETNGNNASTNGKGGNGLLNMKRRARDLGGDYAIESESGKGTSVILRVPLIVKEI